MQTRKTVALVADDHELFRAALAAMLKRDLDFAEVIEAGSLDEAVECLGCTSIDLASFDLAMPGMRGGASLQGIREVFPTVRVVVVTGSTARDDILLALSAGVHGYVPKTLRIHEIAHAFRSVLDGQVFIPPSISEVPPAHARAPSGPDPAAASARVGDLTPRQCDVLGLLAEGKSNKEIARALLLAEGTVKVHVNALYRTLGVTNRVSAVTAFAKLKKPS